MLSKMDWYIFTSPYAYELKHFNSPMPINNLCCCYLCCNDFEIARQLVCSNTLIPICLWIQWKPCALIISWCRGYRVSSFQPAVLIFTLLMCLVHAQTCNLPCILYVISFVSATNSRFPLTTSGWVEQFHELVGEVKRSDQISIQVLRGSQRWTTERYTDTVSPWLS